MSGELKDVQGGEREAFAAWGESIGMTTAQLTAGELTAFKAGAEWQRRAAITAQQGASVVVPGESAEQRFDHYLQTAIDNAPDPLRRLGEWLSGVLDEDRWATAERMINGAVVAFAAAPSPARLNPPADGVMVSRELHLQVLGMLSSYATTLAGIDFPDNDEGDFQQRINETKRAGVNSTIVRFRALLAQRPAPSPVSGLVEALERAHMALIGYLPGHRNSITDAAIESCRAALAAYRAQRGEA